MHGLPRRKPLRFKPGTAEPIEDDDLGSEIAAEQLVEKLGGLAEVRMPGEAEEPILAPSVRAVMLEWMTEIRAKDELAAAKVPARHTALLYGLPGCGKTTLAHHLAARLGMPLVVAEMGAIASEFMNKTGNNLFALFEIVRAHDEPVVMFLDEIDGVGATRLNTGQTAERSVNHAINILLTQIEKFDGLLLAATNRQDALDPALWRRFAMQISVDLPGPDEAFAILKRYSLPFDFSEDLIEALVKLTRGAAPSLLRQLMEGIKRSLILGPRLKRPTDDPVALIGAIIKSVAPHPDYEPPPLWAKPDHIKHLKGMPWPPTMGAK
jgi:hypothetical protein